MRCALIVLFLSFLLVSCEERLRPSFVNVQHEIPSQESWRSRVIFSDSSQVKAILWAGHIAVYATGHFTQLDDSVHVDFYNTLGEHTSTLTARRGRVDDATNNFEAHENVVVVSDSGTTLRTERLYWTNADRTIHTDAFVDITSPTEHISGTGMVSDEALKNYKIFKVSGKSVAKDL
ncbi:MAG TPA: LPS export ABC transporter periplasmic protein LptC [Bacteroidota bacterium]|nr:LPS export ABC transporter periplasmic protein LptC [Bacteroidota bacterium]